MGHTPDQEGAICQESLHVGGIRVGCAANAGFGVPLRLIKQRDNPFEAQGGPVMVKRLIFWLAVALVVAVPLTAEATGGVWWPYNPCPFYQPFEHCNVFGDCYCSFFP
jgi:hypothetical protein